MHLSSKLLILLLALGIQADDIGGAEYPDVRFELYKTSQCKSAGIKGAVIKNLTEATDGGGGSFGKVLHVRSWRATQLEYNNNGIKCYADLFRDGDHHSKVSGSGILTPGKAKCIDLPYGPIGVESAAAYCVGMGK